MTILTPQYFYNDYNYNNKRICYNDLTYIYYINIQLLFNLIIFILFFKELIIFINNNIKIKRFICNKEKYKYKFYNLYWTLIDKYSILYIKINNSNSLLICTIKKIISIIKKIKMMFDKNNSFKHILFIRNGRKIFYINNFESLDIYKSQLNAYDFLVYKNDEYYKIITIHNNNNNINEIIKSNIKFFVVCVSLFNMDVNKYEKYDIYINNFMITDNIILTKEFIIWYLNDLNTINTRSIHFDYDYKVEIIDNNVNKIELNSNQYIKIRDNDYLIYNKIDIKN